MPPAVTHLPGPGRPIPVSTYRVQLRPPAPDHPGFGFDDAAAAVPYLADLGVTTLYCSPHLQAAPGSAHGYDVIDHSRVSSELGGSAGFDRMVHACRTFGLGIVVDVVPNHMAISGPESQNAAWWAVLRDGRTSPYAAWFDIDWEGADRAGGDDPGRVLVPILGAPLEPSLHALELDGDRIRYGDHELPIAPGTLVEGDVPATLAGQHYQLAHWRVVGERLDHRRFFDVTTLCGVRVEDPAVFDATHALVLEQVRSGAVDGLRVDHPDGLADPQGYLQRLAVATGDAWVVVEKILQPGEGLPAAWRTCGTTGYDALNQVMGLFVDPAGEQPLTDLWASTGCDASYDDVVAASKHLVLRDVLAAEVNRLTELGLRLCRSGAALPDSPTTQPDSLAALPDGPAARGGVPRGTFREALVELLAAFPVYRTYLAPSGRADAAARAHLTRAVTTAKATLPGRSAEIDLVAGLALGEGPTGPDAQEFVTRFQQTCGPVMAKGVEDTAFYRHLRLTALNEVGGHPDRFGLPVARWHQACQEQVAGWPLSMTTLSTHDTKRSEDVRARLVLLSQDPVPWAEAATRWSAMAARHRTAAGPDPATEHLLWQTLVGAWPVSIDRMVAYLGKATREAKDKTSWLDPAPAYEQAVAGFVRGVMTDRDLVRELADYVEALAPAWWDTLLAQKLVQLTMPGVADTYQGTELVDLSLVDPDNRRPVDYGARRALLAALGDGPPAAGPAGVPCDPAAKLHVVATALRLRRDHPQWFVLRAPDDAPSYEALEAGERAVAFVRGGAVVTVAPTRSISVRRTGWGADSVLLPAGAWRNTLTGEPVRGGRVALAGLLSAFPVALLVRTAQP